MTNAIVPRPITTGSTPNTISTALRTPCANAWRLNWFNLWCFVYCAQGQRERWVTCRDYICIFLWLAACHRWKCLFFMLKGGRRGWLPPVTIPARQIAAWRAGWRLYKALASNNKTNIDGTAEKVVPTTAASLWPELLLVLFACQQDTNACHHLTKYIQSITLRLRQVEDRAHDFT